MMRRSVRYLSSFRTSSWTSKIDPLTHRKWLSEKSRGTQTEQLWLALEKHATRNDSLPWTLSTPPSFRLMFFILSSLEANRRPITRCRAGRRSKRRKSPPTDGCSEDEPFILNKSHKRQMSCEWNFPSSDSSHVFPSAAASPSGTPAFILIRRQLIFFSCLFIWLFCCISCQ